MKFSHTLIRAKVLFEYTLFYLNITIPQTAADNLNAGRVQVKAQQPVRCHTRTA